MRSDPEVINRGRFRKGQSGNPAGRREGSRNRVTKALDVLLDGQAEALTQKAVDMALSGDAVALRLCLDRIAPARKDRPITFDMPKVETVDDLPKATAALVDGVCRGEITPSEARELGALIEAHAKTIDIADLAERVRRLEEAK